MFTQILSFNFHIINKLIYILVQIYPNLAYIQDDDESSSDGNDENEEFEDSTSPKEDRDISVSVQLQSDHKSINMVFK